MPASLRIHNTRIWTGDSAQPWAAEMIVANGRIAAISRDGSIGDGGTGIRSIDAEGSVVVPGLIDSHMHLLMGGKALGEVDLSGVRSREEFEKAMADADATLPAGRWLIGRGWSEQNWPGGELPDKSWFRRVGTAHRVQVEHSEFGAGMASLLGDAHPAALRGRPCVCHRMDIHAVVVNDIVLDMIDAANLRDPVGGRIVRDANGRPTGLLLEAAAWELINPLIPGPDVASRRECLLAAQSHAHALGLTAVGSMEFAKDVESVFVPMRDRPGLTLRCVITLLDRATGSEPFAFDYGRTFRNDPHLSIIGYKTFVDGTLGSRTARMLANYVDDGGGGGAGNRGMLVELAAAGRLNEWAVAVAHEGLSPSMHAIGDAATRLAIEALSRVDEVARRTGRCVRPRIEHAQHIDPADFAGWRGRIASMQPLHKADDGRYIERRLGRARVGGSFAFRHLINAGATLAFGSDWPVVSCDPVQGMRAAITGLTLDERPFGVEHNLTVEEALRAYTSGAAYCLQLDQAGMLSEGMLGDCVMFDIDPFTADWVRRQPRVIMTVVGGEVVFDATKD